MEFLKPVLGDALYEQVQRKLEGQKDIKLANLALGQYVDKRKFKAKAAALEKAEEKAPNVGTGTKGQPSTVCTDRADLCGRGPFAKGDEMLAGAAGMKGRAKCRQTRQKRSRWQPTCWRTGRIMQRCFPSLVRDTVWEMEARLSMYQIFVGVYR